MSGVTHGGCEPLDETMDVARKLHIGSARERVYNCVITGPNLRRVNHQKELAMELTSARHRQEGV